MRLRWLLIVPLLVSLVGCGETADPRQPRPSSGLGGAEFLCLLFSVSIMGLLVYLWRRKRSLPPMEAPLDRPASPASRQPRRSNPNVQVTLEQEEKRVPVAVEVVKVPPGVTIKVKRTRTVEHAMELLSAQKVRTQVEADLLRVLRSSVFGELERRLGRTYKESSSTEYEVQLNGEKSNQYRLVWVDVWILGEADTPGDGVVAFQFRDRTELEVLPVE